MLSGKGSRATNASAADIAKNGTCHSFNKWPTDEALIQISREGGQQRSHIFFAASVHRIKGVLPKHWKGK